jgi:carboxylate-amine ligase
LLAALTGSSAFHEGADTEYASFRLAWLGLWPQGGIPPAFDSTAEYDTVVADIVGTGLVAEESELLWEVRPSSRFPTIEYRIADMCTAIDDAVLYAALARSLTRTVTARLDRPEPTNPPADAFLRAVRWRAARYGLEGELWSMHRNALVPATEAVEDLLAELRPDLEAHAEWDDVRELADTVLARGTSASRQRSVFTATGDLREVTRDAVARTSAG